MTGSGIGTVLSALLLAGCALALGSARRARAEEVVLDAEGLSSGFETRRVVLDKEKQKLVLDGRAFRYGKRVVGTVTTDVIDLGPTEGVIGSAATVKSVAVEIKAETPEGSQVVAEVRSGARFFDQKDWSGWKKLAGLKDKVGLQGRYLQARIALKTADKTKLPALTGLTLKPEVQMGAQWHGKLGVVEASVQEITRSPIEFKYERPDNPKLVKFRKAARLDEVVAGKFDEKLAGHKQREADEAMKGAGEDFRQLVRLMDWTGSCRNERKIKRHKKPGFYAWDIDLVWELAEVEEGGKKVKRPTIYGHCMSYSEVLTTAATALGFKARHMCMVGFREASHEVCDIWVPSLGKWVYLDPSLTNYYYDKETKVPMNLIEMHALVAEKFVPQGKDMHWWIVRRSGETRARAKAVGGQKHIGSRLGKWRYGAPMPANYDWGWSHGYLAAGFVQMTPRNDFHTDPKANPRKFEYGPGYAGYPNWADAKTPPKRGGGNYYTRMRDFYWTLDQASFRLVRSAAPAELTVELGNSMPFFKEYEVKIDGKKVEAAGGVLAWKLKNGENRLEVAPLDEFGRRGLPSSATLKLGD